MKSGQTKCDVVNSTHFIMQLPRQVHPEVLRRSLDQLLDRHEALRCVAQDRSGELWLSRSSERPDPLIEVVAAPRGDAEGLSRQLGAWLWREIDPYNPPMWRALLLDGVEGGSIVGLVLHHLIADAMSLGRLWKDLRSILTGNRPEGGTEFKPSIGYMAYLAALERWMAGPDGQACERLYCEKLGLDATCAGEAGVSSWLDASPVAGTFGVDRARWTALRERAASLNTTPFVFLTALQFETVARLTGQDAPVLGAVTSVRTSAALAGTVGYMMNTRFYRVLVDRAAPFETRLGAVRSAMTESLKFAHYPSDLLLERLCETGSPPFVLHFRGGNGHQPAGGERRSWARSIKPPPPPRASLAIPKLSGRLDWTETADGLTATSRIRHPSLHALPEAFEESLAKALR